MELRSKLGAGDLRVFGRLHQIRRHTGTGVVVEDALHVRNDAGALPHSTRPRRR